MTNSTDTNDTQKVVTYIRDGDKVGIMVFLRQGGDPNIRNHMGWTLLHLACLEGKAEIAELLLGAGATVNCCTTDMCTPLHLACARGNVKVVEVLANKGAYINAQDKSGNTPLHDAARALHTSIVRYLLEKKADQKRANKKNQVFLDMVGQQMMPAVEAGDTDVLVQWLDWGLSPNTFGNHNWSLLHHASARGQINIASLLLERGADVSFLDSNKGTPLHAASFHGHKRIAELLLGRGAIINAQDQRGNTPLHSAIAGGHPDIINMLLENGCDTAIANKEGQIFTHLVNEFLIAAVQNSRIAHVHSLLKGRANPDTKDASGSPVLCCASFKGDMLTVDALLEAGADPNLCTEDSLKTPLHYASALGNLFVLKALLDKGASVTNKDRNGLTPLHEVVREGAEDVVTVLTGRGASVNAQDSEGNTPLHIAARWGQSDIVEMLLEKGASEEIRNKNGMLYSDLALMRAVRTGDANQVVSGLAWGGDPDVQDSKGWTLLHHAVYKDAPEVCHVLLESDARADIADKHGRTPLLLAAYRGDYQIMEMLLNAGADSNTQDSEGQTPLHWAADEGSVATVELLLRRGANRNVRNKKRLLFSDLLLKHLYFAVRHNDESKVESLLRAGADQTAELAGTGITPREEAKRRKLYPILRKMISLAPSKPHPKPPKEEIVALEDVRKLFEDHEDDDDDESNDDDDDESSDESSSESEEAAAAAYDPDQDACWKMHNAPVIVSAKELFQDEEKSFWEHWEEKPEVVPAKEVFKVEAWWENSNSSSDESSSEENSGEVVPTFEETKKNWGKVVPAKEFFREDECWWRDAVEDLDKPKVISAKELFKDETTQWWDKNSSDEEKEINHTEEDQRSEEEKGPKNEEKSEEEEISVYEDIEESLTDDWETANDSIMSDTSTMYSVSEGDKIMAGDLFVEKPWWDEDDDVQLTKSEHSDNSSSVEDELTEDKSDRSEMTEINEDSSYTEKERFSVRRRILSSTESEASTNIILEDNADNESIGNVFDLDNDEELIDSNNLTGDTEKNPIDNVEPSNVKASNINDPEDEIDIKHDNQIAPEEVVIEESHKPIRIEESETETKDSNSLRPKEETLDEKSEALTLKDDNSTKSDTSVPLDEVCDNANTDKSVFSVESNQLISPSEHNLGNKPVFSISAITAGENTREGEEKVENQIQLNNTNSSVNIPAEDSNTASENETEEKSCRHSLDNECHADIDSDLTSKVTHSPKEREIPDNIFVHTPSIRLKIKDMKLGNVDPKGKSSKKIDEKMVTVRKPVVNKMDACLARVDASLAWLDARMANDSLNENGNAKSSLLHKDPLPSRVTSNIPKESQLNKSFEIKSYPQNKENPETFQIFRVKVRIPEQHTSKSLENYLEKHTTKLELCLKGSSSENALYDAKEEVPFKLEKNETGTMQKYNSLAKLESIISQDKEHLPTLKIGQPSIGEEDSSLTKSNVLNHAVETTSNKAEQFNARGTNVNVVEISDIHVLNAKASNHKRKSVNGQSEVPKEPSPLIVRRHSSEEIHIKHFNKPNTSGGDSKFSAERCNQQSLKEFIRLREKMKSEISLRNENSVNEKTSPLIVRRHSSEEIHIKHYNKSKDKAGDGDSKVEKITPQSSKGTFIINSNEKSKSINLLQSDDSVNNVLQNDDSVNNVLQSDDSVNNVRQNDDSVNNVRQNDDSVNNVRQNDDSVNNVLQNDDSVNNVLQNDDSVNNVRQNDDSVNNVRQNDDSVNNVRQNDDSVNNVRQNDDSVNNVRQNDDSVNNVRQNDDSVNNVRQNDDSVNNVRQNDDSVNNVRQNDDSVNNVRQNDDSVNNVRQNDDSVNNVCSKENCVLLDNSKDEACTTKHLKTSESPSEDPKNENNPYKHKENVNNINDNPGHLFSSPVSRQTTPNEGENTETQDKSPNPDPFSVNPSIMPNEGSELSRLSDFEVNFSPSKSNWRWSTFEPRSLNEYDKLVNSFTSGLKSNILRKKSKSVNSLKDIPSNNEANYAVEGEEMANKHCSNRIETIPNRNLKCFFPTNRCEAESNLRIKPPIPPRRNKDNRQSANISEKFDKTKFCSKNADTNDKCLSYNSGQKENTELEESVASSSKQKEMSSDVDTDQILVVDSPDQTPKPPPRKGPKRTQNIKRSSSCSVC